MQQTPPPQTPEDLFSTQFSAGQVCRVSGVPYRTLDYWATSGVLPPSAKVAEGKGSWRGYTFRDLVHLRVAKCLRDAGLSLQGIRRIQQRLEMEQLLDPSSAETYLVTNGQDVCEITRGRDATWAILRQSRPCGAPWILMDFSHMVEEMRQTALAARRQAH